jgi:hypothetical protein
MYGQQCKKSAILLPSGHTYSDLLSFEIRAQYANNIVLMRNLTGRKSYLFPCIPSLQNGLLLVWNPFDPAPHDMAYTSVCISNAQLLWSYFQGVELYQGFQIFRVRRMSRLDPAMSSKRRKFN